MSTRPEKRGIEPTRPGARACLLALLAASAVLALVAPQARAIIARVEGRSYSYQPAPGAAAARVRAAKGGGPNGKGGPLLVYHEGPVMPSNTNYALYWDPPAAGEYPAGYVSGIDRWFTDLADESGALTNTDSILTQYTDRFGHRAAYESRFGGELLDTDPYPANGCSAAPVCLTDAQLRAEIVAFVEADHLPVDLEHEYFLLTPAGVESCMEAAGKSCSDGTEHRVYCAYHSYDATAEGVLVYADIPYMVGDNCDFGEEHPNGSPSDAEIGGGIAHEHSESVTDPELNAWYDSKGEEVADKCRTFKAKTEYGEPLGKAPDGADFNQVIDGDLYYYQQMFSNATGECEQRVAQLPTVTGVAPTSGPLSRRDGGDDHRHRVHEPRDRRLRLRGGVGRDRRIGDDDQGVLAFGSGEEHGLRDGPDRGGHQRGLEKGSLQIQEVRCPRRFAGRDRNQGSRSCRRCSRFCSLRSFFAIRSSSVGGTREWPTGSASCSARRWAASSARRLRSSSCLAARSA